jgi:hypothetical protein
MRACGSLLVPFRIFANAEDNTPIPQSLDHIPGKYSQLFIENTSSREAFLSIIMFGGSRASMGIVMIFQLDFAPGYSVQSLC